jgi:hypothetical protein
MAKDAEENDIFGKMADAAREMSKDIDDFIESAKKISDDFGKSIQNFF